MNKTLEVFNHIVAAARKGETSTYQGLALACGLPSSGNQMSAIVSPILSNIFIFCLLHEVPYLTSIVVRKSGNEEGLPGAGFWKLLERCRPCAMYDGIGSGSRVRKQSVTNFMHGEVFAKVHMFESNLDMDLLNIADEEPDHLASMWNEKVDALAGRPRKRPVVPVLGFVDERAYLTAQETDNIIEQMRTKIAREFGVTITQDHNGAGNGDAGSRYMTLRFGDCTVSTKILSVESHEANAEHNAFLQEDK